MALINVPLSGQSLGQTRVSINTNFAVISTAFEVDHVAYNAPLGQQGKHNKVTMPVQGSLPVTNSSEVALFSQTSALTGVPEMAFRRANNGSVTEFTSAGTGIIGWTRLPSGILLKWGQSVATGLTTYTFPVGPGIPAFTTIYTVQITTSYPLASDSPNGFARLDSLSAANITVFGSPRTSVGTLPVAYQYLAIGI